MNGEEWMAYVVGAIIVLSSLAFAYVAIFGWPS